MTLLTKVFFYGYVAMLIIVGGAGIFIAEWELRTIFHLDLASMAPDAEASLLNQYRFLKSIELGAGLFGLTFRREIFRGGDVLRVFLAFVFLGVFARSLAVLMDGVPWAGFLVFLVLELITGLLVLYYGHTIQIDHAPLSNPDARQPA